MLCQYIYAVTLDKSFTALNRRGPLSFGHYSEYSQIANFGTRKPVFNLRGSFVFTKNDGVVRIIYS